MADDTWTGKDGREIKVSQMTDEHIVNCLELMRRKAIVLNAELEKRGVEELFDKVKRRHLRELTRDMEDTHGR